MKYRYIQDISSEEMDLLSQLGWSFKPSSEGLILVSDSGVALSKPRATAGMCLRDFREFAGRFLHAAERVSPVPVASEQY